jgi:uncharacterized protein
MTTIIGGLLGAALAFIPPIFAAPRIKVMLLDGEQAGAYHAWQETTPYLKRMLADAGIFEVDVVTAPPPDGDFSSFKPDWSKYQVVVSNYDAPDARWSGGLKASFEEYVRNAAASSPCTRPTTLSRNGKNTT